MGKLFGGTVPPNNTLFGGTVPPNSTLFGGTPDSDKEYIISSINGLILNLRNQQSQFILWSSFWSSDDSLLCEPSKRKGGGGVSAKIKIVYISNVDFFD